MKNKIADNESFKDLKKHAKSAKVLKRVSKILGVNHNIDFDELVSQTHKLEQLPDSFNQTFAQKGWIAHDSLDVKVMEKSIQLGSEEGEDILIGYYEEQLEWFFKKLAYRPIFKERIKLLKLAKEDYFCERYHSCVPIVLMLVDGIVNDFKNTGLFADSTDLNVWDSIAGHSTGLESLAVILTKNRKKTTVEPIDLPYRNGILHGRDLGYNNKIVAIKSFAILFYVYDWSVSLDTENDRKKKYSDEKQESEKTTLADLLKKTKDFQRRKEESDRLLKKWKPRNFDIDSNGFIPEAGTPEEVVFKFLNLIKKRNYGLPVNFYAKNIYKNISIQEKAGLFRKEFESTEIHNFKISSIVDVAPAVTEVVTIVDYTKNGVRKNSSINFRMIYEMGDKTENRLVEGGGWKIVNIEGISFQL